MKILNLQIWRPRSIVLTALSLFLGSFYILMGTMKISPIISSEIHRELRRNFIHFSKFTPIITTVFGIRISPRMYRICWGTLESLAGFILIFVPINILKIISNIILLFLTLFSIYNHHYAGHRFDRIAPSIVFTLMLICRLVVEYQVRLRLLNEINRNKQNDDQRQQIPPLEKQSNTVQHSKID